MKAIVLLSGGADSRLLLRRIAGLHGKENVVALFCDYGQLMPEKAAARIAASEEGVTLFVRTLPYTPSSNLTDIYYSENPNITEKVPPSWVPGRNLMILSLALSMGEVMGTDTIYFGFNAEDAKEFPDCSHEFIQFVNAISTRCTGRRMIVSAPFMQYSKETIFRELEKEGLTPEDYVTGYPGTKLEDHA